MQAKSNGLTTMQRTEDGVGLDLERRRDKMAQLPPFVRGLDSIVLHKDPSPAGHARGHLGLS